MNCEFCGGDCGGACANDYAQSYHEQGMKEQWEKEQREQYEQEQQEMQLQYTIDILKQTLLENQKVLIILRDACVHEPTRNVLAELMDANTRVLGMAGVK